MPREPPSRRSIAVVSFLLLLSIGLGVPAAVAATSDYPDPAVPTDATVDVTRELRLTPERPGSIRAEFRYALPDQVTGLTVTVPEDATVTDRVGFERTGSRTFDWDQKTGGPILQFRLPANETDGKRGTLARDGRYTFVDPGPWALVRLPSVSTEWRWTGGGRVTLDTRTTTDGPGAVGSSLAFLGPHRTVTREVYGTTLRLIVPDRASLAERPDAILGSVADASERVRFGEPDETVTMVAAPSGTVTWAVGGLQIGAADFWVRDQEELDTANNAWLHEFVHTRQEYETAASGRWTLEATATYYAALLALDQEHITFETFRRRLAIGTRDPDGSAVLAEPGTWEPVVPYTKGALVAGELDRQTRIATGDRTLDAVIRRLNAQSDPVTNGEFRAAMRDIAGSDVAAAADRYTTTEAVSDAWDRAAHREAFESPIARMEYVPESVTIKSTYRNESPGTGPIRLVRGETLNGSVTVTNEGSATGTYTARLTVNGTVVDSSEGSLEPGASTAVTLAHRFVDTGRYAVRIAETDRTVQVDPASTPRVVHLNTSAAERGAATVTVVARVDNPTTLPADGRLTLRRNGTAIAERRIILDSGSAETLQFESVAAPPGTILSIGNRSLTVPRVTTGAQASGDSDRTTPTETGVTAPGFVALATLCAVVGALVLARRTG